ncbi:MAG: ImmA/IrrE family metallo-endopeptidase [Dehalococcoidales bacterium]|nr:ImmA/IrrE family metallo-endopeptidase [Dehalococcoidales bacterium]
MSEVLSKKRNLTLPMIKALSKGLGIPSDVLLHEYQRLQNKDCPNVEFEKFPVREMMKKGWIKEIPDFKSRSREIILDLIDNAGGIESVKGCLFRQSKSARENEKNDEYALAAWCLKVLSIANEKPSTVQYVEGTLDNRFLREVAKLSYFKNGPALAKEYLEKHGIHLVTLEHLSKTYLDGAVLFPANRNPVIGLTLRYDRMDNFWFCLLHELAHLSIHSKASGVGIIIDDLDLRKYDERKEDDLEKQADSLAQEALIPGEAWDKTVFPAPGTPKLAQIMDLAGVLKIDPAIIAGRIRYETNNYRKFSDLLGHGKVRRLFSNN